MGTVAIALKGPCLRAARRRGFRWRRGRQLRGDWLRAKKSDNLHRDDAPEVLVRTAKVGLASLNSLCHTFFETIALSCVFCA